MSSTASDFIPATEEQQQAEKEDNNRRRESSTMSLYDVVQPHPPPSPPRQSLPAPLLDERSSPTNAQIFEFCNPNIFSNALQSSNPTSDIDNCNFNQNQNLTFTSETIETNNNANSINKYCIEPVDISKFLGDQNEHNTSTTSSSTTTTITTTTNPHSRLQSHNIDSLSIVFHSQDDVDDISASIDFSASSPLSDPTPYTINATYSATQQDHYQLPLTDVSQYPTSSVDHATILPGVSGQPLFGMVFEEDCLDPFLRLNPSNSSPSSTFLDPIIGPFIPGNLNNRLGVDSSNIFPGSFVMASEFQAQEVDFQEDNGGIFCPDQLGRIYNSADKQAFSSESSQLASAARSSAPSATEISGLEDSNFKVGKLSVEQRKEKINRYMKKRNQRNFSKKIKYACRKTLADSRPRVRGRFAKNDDFMETNRHTNGQHEDDDYDDMVTVKEEDDLVDSSDIFSHISGVNSLKCNYQIQSWI